VYKVYTLYTYTVRKKRIKYIKKNFFRVYTTALFHSDF